MKKFFFSLLLLVGLSARAAVVPVTEPAPAQQPGFMAPARTMDHIEFKYYGFYCVVDYTNMFCFTHFSGQYMEPNTGQIIGFHDNYQLNGVTAVAGWQWRKETALGLGFSYLNDPMKSFSQIPVFLEFRSHFLRSRITPFTSIQLGYTIPFGSKNLAEEYTRIDRGGIMFAFNIGGRFAIRPKFGINIYVGYQLVNLDSVERGFGGVASTRMSELYDNIRFGLGVNF